MNIIGECHVTSPDTAINQNNEVLEQPPVHNKEEINEISGWFIKPIIQEENQCSNNMKNTAKKQDVTSELLTDEFQKIVILYLHGTGGTRSTQYRSG